MATAESKKFIVSSDYFFWFLIGSVFCFAVLSFWSLEIRQVLFFMFFAVFSSFVFNLGYKWLVVSFFAGFVAGFSRVFVWGGQDFSLPAPVFLTGFLESVKGVFALNLQKLFPEPTASFAQGIILGGQDLKFSNQFWQALKITSTAHIIAVSGYNITLIARGISSFLVWISLHRKLIWIFAIFGVFVFVILVGAPASAVRAGMFSVLLLAAERFGRQQNTRIAFAFILALMLFFEPLALKSDLGFQLSFLASFGIFYLAPRLYAAGTFDVSSKLMNKDAAEERESRGFGFKKIIFETLSAQAMVMPLLIYEFGSLSFLGVLANFLILPMIPFAMSLSFLSGLGMAVNEVLGRVIGFLSFPFLNLIIKIIEFFASLPLAGFFGIYPGVWFLVVCYGAVVLFLAVKKNHG